MPLSKTEYVNILRDTHNSKNISLKQLFTTIIDIYGTYDFNLQQKNIDTDELETIIDIIIGKDKIIAYDINTNIKYANRLKWKFNTIEGKPYITPNLD